MKKSISRLTPYFQRLSTLNSTRMILVRGTPTAGDSLYTGSSSPGGGSKIISIIGSYSSIQIPHVKKCCGSVAAKFQAPKTPRTDTILSEHLLAHTLITGIYVYSHYCIWSFCHHFPCKNDVLIISTRIEFSNPDNIATDNLHKLSNYC